jgi:antitoxin VapB
MTLSIRNPEADGLARRLAELDGTSITEAVVTALKEALRNRAFEETPVASARRILAKHGLKPAPGHRPADRDVYLDLDEDLSAGRR